jgi:hypothetical protein
MRPGIRRILKWIGFVAPTTEQLDALDAHIVSVLAEENS